MKAIFLHHLLCGALLSLGLLTRSVAATPHDGRPGPRKATPAPPACCDPQPATKAANTITDTPAPATPATIQLTGVVLLPNGRPCAGASVFPALNPRLLAVTDANGAFSLVVPAQAAPLSLKVDMIGEGSSYVRLASPSAEPLRITLGQ